MTNITAEYPARRATIYSMSAYDRKDSTGNRIRWARKRLGWGQDEVSRRVGIGVVYLSALENDKRAASRETMARLAEALGVSRAFLEMEIDAPDPLPGEPAAQGMDVPNYMHEESDEAAQLIDSMSDELRSIALDLVRVLAMHDTGGEGDADGARTVVIDTDRAAIVRQIAAEYLNGRGVISIATGLTQRGVPTPAGGAVWLKNSVAIILQRAWTYAGYAEYYRKRRTGYIRARGTWEPIWDEATAERIEQEQQARAANRRIADTPSRLTGIVWCLVCGRPMWQVRNESGEIRDGHNGWKRRAKFYCQPGHPGGSVGTHLVTAALAMALDDLAGADLSAIPDEDGDSAATLQAQIAEHDATIAKHRLGLERADTAWVSGAMDDDRYKRQVDRLVAAIEVEESAKTKLMAAADAARQRGSRADWLAETAAAGPAMLTTDDTAAANAWLRRRVRVYVRDNSVVDVRFDFW